MYPGKARHGDKSQDLPYTGKVWLYRDHPDYGGEVDHATIAFDQCREHRAVRIGDLEIMRARTSWQ